VNSRRALTATAAVLSISLASQARAQTSSVHTLNHGASVVGFTISGSMIFKVSHDGRFNDFTGEVYYDPAHPGSTHVALTVYTGSVDTRDAKNDQLLRSREFFDVEHFPTMQFVSASASSMADGTLAVTGDMTIRGVTKRITIPVKFRPDQQAGVASSGVFESTFQIDRTEFGLNGIPKWNGFRVSISKNVQIHVAIATTIAPPR